MEIKKTLELAAQKLKVLIYGEAGNGKTRFSGTTKPRFNPFIISAESGLLSLNKLGHKYDYTEIKSWKELAEIFNFLKMGKHEYDTVILDSVSEMQNICMAQLLADSGKEQLQMQEWGLLGTRMQSMIRSFRDLDMNVIMTCLAETKTDELTGKTHTGPLLSGKTRDMIPAFFDEVFYAGVKTGKDKDGKEVRKHYLLTAATETHIAKDRSGMLPQYVEPDFTKVYDLIFNNQPKGE